MSLDVFARLPWQTEPELRCRTLLLPQAAAQSQGRHPSGLRKGRIPHSSENPGNRGSPRALISARVLCSPYQHLYRHSPCRSSVNSRLCRAAAKSLLSSSWHYGKISMCHEIDLPAHKPECGRIPRRPGHHLTVTQLVCRVRITLRFAHPRADPLSSTMSAAPAGNPGAPASCKLVSHLP